MSLRRLGLTATCRRATLTHTVRHCSAEKATPAAAPEQTPAAPTGAAASGATPALTVEEEEAAAREALAAELTYQRLAGRSATPSAALAEMTPTEILALPALEIARAIAEKLVSAEAIAEACLEKLQADTALYANVTSLSRQAVEEAMALDEHLEQHGVVVGPLHGVPFLVSDNIHVAGFPTSCGTHLLAGYYPSKTAPAVECLLSAGAVLVGKANMDEFGIGLLGHNKSTGSLRNPLEPNFYAGGAHGGSASSVVLDCVPFAVATDITGELLIPAAFCGVIGFVGSPGSFSRQRTWMLSNTMGALGVVAKTVSCVHAVTHVMAASTHDENARAIATSVPTPPLLERATVPVLHVPEDHFAKLMETPMESAFRMTLTMLEVQGVKVYHTVKEAQGLTNLNAKEKPVNHRSFEAHYSDNDEPENNTLAGLFGNWMMNRRVLDGEAVSACMAICEKAGINYEQAKEKLTSVYAQQLLSAGAYTTSSEAKQEADAAELLADALIKYWDDLPDTVDALVFPTVFAGPPAAGKAVEEHGLATFKERHIPAEMLTRNTGPFSMIGCPSMTIPLGRKISEHLVGGLMVVCRRGQDERLLEVAAMLDEMIKVASAELDSLDASKIQNTFPVMPGGPDWLEDRNKNMWARGHDHFLAIQKFGGV